MLIEPELTIGANEYYCHEFIRLSGASQKLGIASYPEPEAGCNSAWALGKKLEFQLGGNVLIYAVEFCVVSRRVCVFAHSW